ncbi:tRNA (adenosine(37)-N6)-threonylcarbamoyltransferase complex ATPase subunit type 1 TsaE [Pseudoalteromonas sp. SSDWG2]|uniref:tRNA (adenosine(37)-N6)-threonylcarbamoyltransferase complex ATPase subunit type 1 TsaE n=1 Tax=Pseudoalteromonas sp. SSDWG2 TaxID=3139391 RepID=UPI003BAB9E0F
MSDHFVQFLADESATVAFGNQLASLVAQGVVIYLYGDLGAGKTTLTRGIVQGFGHQGKVKSPTYTLVEPYELPEVNIYHFDLYRLADPEELEFMGIRDYFDDSAVCILEWPSKGEGVIPPADLDITLKYIGEAREVTVAARTQRGIDIVLKLQGNA